MTNNQTLSKLANKIIALRSAPSPIPAPLTYKSGGHTSAMIALFLPTNIGSHFMQSDPGALPPSELHITLVYLGKANDLSLGQVKAAHGLMRLISENHPPLTGHINGCGRFCNDDDDGDPFFIIPDLPALPNLRQVIIDGLGSHAIEGAKDHGYVPHITLTHLPHAEYNPFDILEKTPISFGAISLVLGDDRYDYPLTQGVPFLSKAALIEKIGARHTGAECSSIQKMHNLTLDLGAECHPLTRRAGARHSHADRAMVQRMHDDCVGLGAECKALPEKDRVYGSQVLKEEPGAEVTKHLPGKHRQKAHSGGKGASGKTGRKGTKKPNAASIAGGLPENLGLMDRKKKTSTIKQLSELSTNELEKAFSTNNKRLDNPKNDLELRNALIFGKMLEDATKKRVKRLKAKKADLITRAQSDAPNYQPASTPQRCANCRFFLGDPGRDWCEKFDFTADLDYVSDAWEAQRPDEIPGYVANKGDLAALTEGILILRGGRTSGNWGHAGRKGKRGGSGRGGGFGRIGVKPGSKPGRKKVQAAAKEKAKAAAKKPAASKKSATKPKAKPKAQPRSAVAKKPAAKPEPVAKPKAQAKKPTTGSTKLDDIFDKAPKGTKQNFTNHLMNKMASGEISMQDAQKLNARFTTTKEPATKPPTAKKKPTTKEKPSKPSKDLKPGKGEKVSDGLRLGEVPKSEAGKAVHDTVSTINSVHSDGKLTSIPVEMNNSKRFKGSFEVDPIFEKAKVIKIKRDGATPHMTTAHEIGHNLDFQAIGRSGAFGDTGTTFNRKKDAEVKAKFEKLQKAMNDSNAISALRDRAQGSPVKVKKGEKTLEYKPDKRYSEYMLEGREMFARGYAQYITTKSGDKKMKAELAGMRKKDKKAKINYHRQWEDDDFKTISKSFDDLFVELGWLE